MSWLKTVQNDLDSHRLSWTEAVDLTQNGPLWRLLASSGATHSLWCKLKTTMTISGHVDVLDHNQYRLTATV